MNFEQNESQSSLRAVVNRVVKRRQHWLEEQRIDVPSWVVEQGMKAVLEYLEKEEITSVTEEKLSEVWHKFGQQAAHEIAALIHQGADVKTPDGGAALRITATDGHVDVVSLLLEQGADVAAVNNLGRTALHHAASNGHIKVVSLLVERGSDVAASDNDGLTVLHHAVTSGSTEVVKLLLDRGADAHALTKDGHNVLSHMVVAKDGNPDDSYIAIVRLLCLQERKLQLPPSTQNLPLKKYQLGLLACAEYWQDRHEKNQPLLEVPSEVVKGGEDAVKSYLTELEKTDASELIYRRKICVIGPSTWGKTSLIRSITKDTPVLIPITDRTTGIDLFSLRFTEEGSETEEKYHDVTFWDFADEDVYHVAHAVFFSRRTLYLVCIDLQAYDEMFKNANADVNKMKSFLEPERIKQRFFEKNILRWIVLILFRQPDAQFKLIGTKHDLVSDDASRIAVAEDVRFRLNEFLDDPDVNVEITGEVANRLKRELDKEMVTASVTNVEAIQKVKDSIKDAIIATRDLSFKMPATYTQVLKYIVERRHEASTTQQERMDNVIVSVDELCRDLMRTLDLQDTLCTEILRVLHDLGDILWYEASGEEFNDWIIIDPVVMLDLVREVINHKYEDPIDPIHKRLWRDGTLPHSLLVTFQSWKCLGRMDENGEMVHLFKRLLHHLNLVYPVNVMESIDKADIIVPMYWKARKRAKKALKPLTRQNTTLVQDFGGSSYIAKWRYSFPIVISEAVFVNFVVKCYLPYAHREARDTHFEISVRDEFRAAIYLCANKTGRYDDIAIEVAAATKKLAWAEMMYFVIDMEKILKSHYPGLTKYANLKRCIVDVNGEAHDVNWLLKESVDDARLRRTKAPWLPPNFDWFIQRAWENLDVLDNIRFCHRLQMLEKLIVTNDKRRLPALWSLAYPKKGQPVEIRIHSDFSGKCWHEPLKIQITDNFFTKHSKFFQVGISLFSVISAAIPVPVINSAVTQVLVESKSVLDQAITAKDVVNRAHIGPGEKKSSTELGMGPAERTEFLLALLAQHEPPIDERTIGENCNLHRVAKDSHYIWASQEELNQMDDYVKCDPEPCDTKQSPPVVAPTVPSISLSIANATGSWDAKIFTKMYCEWKLEHGIKTPIVKSEGCTDRASSTSARISWGSNFGNVNVDSIEMLRNCTLHVWVKQTRRLTSCFRDDKVVSEGEKKLDDHVAADCCNDQTIDVEINMDEVTSPPRKGELPYHHPVLNMAYLINTYYVEGAPFPNC